MERIYYKKLPKIGEGRHGKVYLLDQNRCIKKYKNKKYARMEYQVLEHSKGCAHFPCVYYFEDRFMIREYFNGPDARQYINQYGLSKAFVRKLIKIIDIFIKLGYSRIDCRLSHIIVTKDMELKIIDPTRNMHKKVDYPRQMLSELKKLGYKEKFLQYVKELNPDYYHKWNK